MLPSNQHDIKMIDFEQNSILLARSSLSAHRLNQINLLRHIQASAADYK